jgi:anaerobic ribonucleoside-triphosphate reductase
MKPVCSCGAHNVFQLSRVTGYLSDVSNYNSGKFQEIKDRVRYNL